MTILLVEDDSLLAMTESHWLSRAGYNVIHCLNGEAAVETVMDKKDQIDLILMDINLGRGMDGTEAAMEILKDNDIPLLFLSSHTEKRIVEKTEQITSYGYVIKDSKDVVLIASIKMAFKLHQTSKQLRDKEKALKESQVRLKRAELVSKTGHWEYRPDSLTMVASEGACKIYELDEERVLLSEVRKKTLSEYYTMLDESMKNLIEFNKPYDVEFKIQKQNNGKIVDIHSIAEYDKNENIVFGTIQDITDQKSVEAFLEESKERYRILTESMKDVVWVLDTETLYFLYISPSVKSLRGFTEEEVMSVPVDASLDPEEKEKLKLEQYQRIEEFLSDKNNSKYYIDEIQQPCKDGSMIWVEIITRYYLNEKNGHVELRGVTKDITERKNAEQILRESEENFRAIFENNSSAIAIIESDTTISMVNNAYCRMSGYSIDEAVGMSWTQQVSPEELDKLKENNRQRLINPKSVPESYEFSFYTKSGQVRISQIYISFIQNTKRIVASFVDITERNHAEKEIVNSLSILEATLNSTVDGILVVDNHRRIVKYNNKFTEILGVPADALSSNNDNILLKFIAKKAKDPDSFISRIKQLYDQPEDVSFDIVEFKDGRIIERYSQPQLINNQSVGRVWCFRDVTERKLSEEALRESENMLVTVFQNSPISFAITTAEEGRYYDVNEIFLRETGYTREEVIGNTSLDLNIFSNFNERARLTEEIMKNGFLYGMECHFRKKNGEIIIGLISSVKVKLGNRQFFFSSILDISERKQSEIQLQRISNELKSLNNAKDKFFSIISHDLRNPFHSINSALKLLLDEIDSFTTDERNIFLKSLLTTSERAYSLLENLLLWSRQQMGNIEFEPEVFELAYVVIESIRYLEHSSVFKNITVTSSIKNNIFVKADKNMIETVLRNLLTNAIKFTSDNGIIKIEAFELDGCVRINVVDNGNGIQSEDMEKLFRIDQSFSTKGTKGEGGTGLGLIICKDFIEKNDGKIWVESEFGKGSKFSFELPKS